MAFTTLGQPRRGPHVVEHRGHEQLELRRQLELRGFLEQRRAADAERLRARRDRADENPQIGGDASDPGTLNPDVPMLEMTTSAADGRFEFALGASSYHVCTPVGADPDAQMVLCSDAMIIVGANPMHVAIYEHGNGPTQSESWSTSSCLD